MSLVETLSDRSYEEYKRDPNINGAFVGGPPLLSAAQMRELLQAPSKEVEQEIQGILERYRESDRRSVAENKE